MNVVIIGSGNVAQVLGKKLLDANHIILQVFGRNWQTLQECATLLQAMPVTNIADVNKDADVCIIATSDSAVPAIATQLHPSNSVVVHTSGGVSIGALHQHKCYGVLYPLQSLRKELPYLPKIPFFVDGNTNEVKTIVASLAKTISDDVHFANDEARLKLHVAAVFCSNFANHLFAMANQFCNNEQLSFNYLVPLITETVQRMEFDAPANLQTGPAVRHDEATIQRHLQVLQTYPLLAEVYKMLTISIQQWHADN